MIRKIYRKFKKKQQIISINKSMLNDFQSRRKLCFERLNGENIDDNDNQALSLLLNGNALVVRNYLQDSKCLPHLEKILDVKFDEIPKLHHDRSPMDIMSEILTSRADVATLSLQSFIISEFSESLGLDHIYCELEPNIRLHPPYNIVKKYEKEIEATVGSGQLTAHSVHKDSWYHHPKNTMNIWIACTDVNAYSGMSILEHSQDYYPPVDDQELVDYKDALSHQHHDLELRAGDAVIFLSELVHSSILNQSETTRGTISMRFTLETPKHQKHKQYWYKDFRKNAKNDWQLKGSDVLDDNSFNLNSVITNDLEAVEPDVQTTRIGSTIEVQYEEKTYTFPLKCPHRGVELSGGHFCTKDRTMVCPAHRMHVQPRSIQ